MTEAKDVNQGHDCVSILTSTSLARQNTPSPLLSGTPLHYRHAPSFQACPLGGDLADSPIYLIGLHRDPEGGVCVSGGGVGGRHGRGSSISSLECPYVAPTLKTQD